MSPLLIHDIPDSERPRERLQRLGAASLSDMELLAILLRTGVHGCSAVELAGELLQYAGGKISNLAEWSVEELTKLNGMGPTKAITLVAAFELARRSLLVLPPKAIVKSVDSVVNYCRSQITDNTREELHLLTLDVQNRIIGDEIISTGLINQTLAHAREIFRPAIRAACYRIILWHNHPSGDCRPSSMDDEVTRQTLIAGQLLDIELIDHVIIGRPEQNKQYPMGYFSYKESQRFMEILKNDR